MIAMKYSCREPGGRFAIVDELAPVRFLSREEFESMKQLNPRLIEMKAGDDGTPGKGIVRLPYGSK